MKINESKFDRLKNILVDKSKISSFLFLVVKVIYNKI